MDGRGTELLMEAINDSRESFKEDPANL